MGIFDEIDSLLEMSNRKLYGEYTKEEQELINSWNNMLGEEEGLKFTVFRDANFLHVFLKNIKEDQFEYVLNTYKMNRGLEYDPKYAIVTLRSIPSIESKPEAFWTTEHREVISGLTNEMPKGSPQRIYSAILVSTMEKLKEHGLSYTTNGVSDGEIVIDPTKPFSDFLFMYKPESEIREMQDYITKRGYETSMMRRTSKRPPRWNKRGGTRWMSRLLTNYMTPSARRQPLSRTATRSCT